MNTYCLMLGNRLRTHQTMYKRFKVKSAIIVACTTSDCYQESFQ
jgi:hypothetical protein